jgi:hypothetical protein
MASFNKTGLLMETQSSLNFSPLPIGPSTSVAATSSLVSFSLIANQNIGKDSLGNEKTGVKAVGYTNETAVETRIIDLERYEVLGEIDFAEELKDQKTIIEAENERNSSNGK